MKKAIVAIALAGFASTALATIAGSPHDLSDDAGAQLSSCQFCHTPHNSNTTAGGTAPVAYDYAIFPLWNREQPTQTYSFYTAVTDTSLTIGSGTFACLSCHDGASDMGETYGASTRGFTATRTIGAASYGNLGLNLQNDHPVGVTFQGGTTGYATLATITGAGLKVYGTQNAVECGSCHDPHGTWNAQAGGAAFLRITANVICSTCHLK